MALRPRALALLVLAAATLVRPVAALAGGTGARVPRSLATSGLPALSPTPPEPLPAAPAGPSKLPSPRSAKRHGATTTLPHTGLGLAALAGVGCLLLVAGALARRAARVGRGADARSWRRG